MPIFKPFNNNETCHVCGKNMNDVALGIISCQKCLDDGEKTIAQMTVIQHLVEAAKCFFNFEFDDALAEFIWSQERLFKTGDYHPVRGIFITKGYIKY